MKKTKEGGALSASIGLTKSPLSTEPDKNRQFNDVRRTSLNALLTDPAVDSPNGKKESPINRDAFIVDLVTLDQHEQQTQAIASTEDPSTPVLDYLARKFASTQSSRLLPPNSRRALDYGGSSTTNDHSLEVQKFLGELQEEFQIGVSQYEKYENPSFNTPTRVQVSTPKSSQKNTADIEPLTPSQVKLSRQLVELILEEQKESSFIM